MRLADIFIAAIMILIMFSIGLAIKPKNIASIIEEKKTLLIGLFFQLIFLPAFALLVLHFTSLSPTLKAGFFIVSICPGGTMSNFITYLLKGDIALSFSLTTVNTLIILFTVPLFAQFAVSYYTETPLNESINLSVHIFKIIGGLLIPASAGIFFKYLFPRFGVKIQKPLKIINSILLALVFTIKIFGNQNMGGSGITFHEILSILPFAFFIHFGAMFITHFITLRIGIPKLKASTIAIEVGLQNTTLALLITGTILQDDTMSKPAIVFAMFTFFTTLLFGFYTLRVAKN